MQLDIRAEFPGIQGSIANVWQGNQSLAKNKIPARETKKYLASTVCLVFERSCPYLSWCSTFSSCLLVCLLLDEVFCIFLNVDILERLF